MENKCFLITEAQIIKLFEKAFDAKGDIQDLISLERAAGKYDVTKKFLYNLNVSKV